MCLYNSHILFIHVRGGRAHSTIFLFLSCAVGNKQIWGKVDSGRLWFSFLERGKEGRTTRAGVAGRARRIWNCPQ